MKEGNKKEMIESEREEKRKERKLEKDLKRRRKKKSAEERGEDLQDTVARRPGELPPPLRKPLQKLIHHFLIWGDSRRLRWRLPGPKSSPLCPQSLSNCCLSLKKIKSFLNSGAFKTDCMHNMQRCSLEKTPSGGSHPG